MSGRTVDEHGKQIVGLQFSDPVGKACKFVVKYQDKRTQNLGLIKGRSFGIRVKRGKKVPNRIQIHGSKFIPGIGHGIKFFELRRI